MNRTLALIALILPLFATAGSQSTLTEADKKQVVQTLCQEMNARYVFADVAKKATSIVEKKLAAGEYASIDSGAAFAAQLVKDLNSACKDAHLRIRYSEEKLPVRKERGEPSKAELEEFTKFTRLNNAGFEKIERLPGNIGYIKFNGFFDPEEAAQPIRAAMDFVANTDALIFDIRENGGGDPATVRLICSYLFDDKPVHLNSLKFREGDKIRVEEFWTLKKVPGKRYVGKDIYVLMSKRTGSGAEEFAYNLKTQKRATLYGTSTWGGANPGGNVRLTDHFSVFIPVGCAMNPITKTNWEGTGVLPDIETTAEDALRQAHLDAIRKLQSKAKDPNDQDRLKASLEAAEKLYGVQKEKPNG